MTSCDNRTAAIRGCTLVSQHSAPARRGPRYRKPLPRGHRNRRQPDHLALPTSALPPRFPTIA